MSELLTAARAAFGAARHGERWLASPEAPPLSREALAAALDDPEALVVSGHFGGAVVGCGIATVAPGDGRTRGLVRLLYVEPAAREVGVGEAMLETIIAWCQAKECVAVELVALPGDRSTKSLAERSGFAASAIVLRRSLAGEMGTTARA